MRTTRKIITLIAALALIFASVVPAFAAEFSDLEDHWSKQFMEKLVEKGVMAGYADGTIKPDRTVTAAELPIGILCSIIGTPFFVYLLKKTKGGGWR